MLASGVDIKQIFGSNLVWNFFIKEDLSNVDVREKLESGTASTVAGSNTITGVGTNWQNYMIGRRIKVGSEEKYVLSVTSATSLSVDSNFVATNSGVSYSFAVVYSWFNDSTLNSDYFTVSGIAGAAYLRKNNGIFN